MSDIRTGAPAAKFAAGHWAASRSASVKEGGSPWAVSQITFAKALGLDRDDVAAAVASPVPASRVWSRQDV